MRQKCVCLIVSRRLRERKRCVHSLFKIFQDVLPQMRKQNTGTQVLPSSSSTSDRNKVELEPIDSISVLRKDWFFFLLIPMFSNRSKFPYTCCHISSIWFPITFERVTMLPDSSCPSSSLVLSVIGSDERYHQVLSSAKITDIMRNYCLDRSSDCWPHSKSRSQRSSETKIIHLISYYHLSLRNHKHIPAAMFVLSMDYYLKNNIQINRLNILVSQNT